MGMDMGCAGALGINLSVPVYAKIRKHLIKVYEEFLVHLHGEHDRYLRILHGDIEVSQEEFDAMEALSDLTEEERQMKWAEPFKDRFIEALAKAGIIFPKQAKLLWTGDEDDRPARCDTPAGDWILGFGLFTFPWEYPELDPSFKETANFHTWVWAG